ncbi:major facilitator transporter [Bifidobacterium pseudolongum subsp. globosum]|uniref:hypothetical protein n=1 Tax=Bifidobacterium pseudolongum TaxID=1694 RepID=UPI000CB067A3|nr:hypothetical protein [Bifidobacterium pseudolongum]PKU98184.1 major facilitator transporter [Bifidobacterium pseudolongum subsp. globosum]
MAALFAARMLTYPLLLVIATLGSAVSGFLGSATDAMLRSIIGVRDYSKALSLNRGRDATISIAGNPVGGFLYGVAPWLPFLVTVMIAAAVLNYGVSGIAATMLVGAFAAARLSDRVPVGGCICVSFVFLCVCVAPMLFAYGPGASRGASYALVFVVNAVMSLPFPIIDALLLGFVYAKAPTSMQGRIAVSLTVPAQAFAAFSSASAGALLPVLGFRGTIAVFLATLALSTVMVLCSARIRRIPRADGWDTAEL